jgi:RND superfamily putative drug exporter
MPTSVKQRRRRWIVPTVLILIWLVFAGGGGSYAQKLGEVVSNDSSAFLPSDAEATEVAKASAGFTGAEQTPAIVVYSRDGGITDADRVAVTGDARFFATVSGVQGQVIGPVPATDGAAVQLIVPLASGGDASEIPDAVTTIRDRAQSHPGLTAHVAGPAGTAADLNDIFAGADVRLLGVALIAVFIILMLVYRSIILPIVVLISAEFAQTLASVAVYFLAKNDVIQLNGQSQGALVLICIATATDYALLLVGRYREELRDNESKYDAMRTSLRSTVPTILASGVTVILAMLCLLLSKLGSDRGYGPVFALGVTASLIATFTLLPAILVLLGRAAFWPRRPAYGSEHQLEHGVWHRVAGLISRHPRLITAGTVALLLALTAFLPLLKVGNVPIGDQLLNDADSVAGQEVISRHFPGGTGVPAQIIGPEAKQADLVSAARGTTGVADVVAYTGSIGGSGSPKVVDGRVLLEATLTDPSDSDKAADTVERLRTSVHAVDAGAQVGGVTAVAVDTESAAWRDLRLIAPLALAVVFILLILLLRALVAPVLLIITVVLSVAATFGASALIFNASFEHPTMDPTLPLFCIVFLIAVGVDYNIFLMARVREESARHGDTRQGVIRGLTTTGGVITSAGIVLGATFSLFAVLPLLPLVQIGIIIVVGVVLDTFIVRALLVPTLAYDIGGPIWWPSALYKRSAGAGETSAVPPAEKAKTL